MSRHHRKLDRRRWAILRRQILDSANWKCAICGGYAREVDHVIPLDRGGDPWDPGNLQPICSRDHRIKSASERGVIQDPERDKWDALLSTMRKRMMV